MFDSRYWCHAICVRATITKEKSDLLGFKPDNKHDKLELVVNTDDKIVYPIT